MSPAPAEPPRGSYPLGSASRTSEEARAFLLTGEVVFDGASFIEVCGHHLHSAPVPPSQRLGRPLPDDVESMILRCLEKTPSARPKDATALHDALAQCRDATEWGKREARAWWAARGGAGGGAPSKRA